MDNGKTKPLKTFYVSKREDWRKWLTENFEKEENVWFIFPTKASGEKSVSYNDAVEEALCFGWIDSTIKNIDPLHRAQRFSPRHKGSGYSRLNIERLIWLEGQGMIHPKIRENVLEIINAPYKFPKDIINAIKSNKEAWKNYENFSEEYKRIRVAYIDTARKCPLEFEKRLKNFIQKTKNNKFFGYGGIDKYYGLGTK